MPVSRSPTTQLGSAVPADASGGSNPRPGAPAKRFG